MMIFIFVGKTKLLCPFHSPVRWSELRCDNKNLPVPSVEFKLIRCIFQGCPSFAIRIFRNKAVQQDSALSFRRKIIRIERMLILGMQESVIMIARTMQMRHLAVYN